jgi:hypothetical protein
MQFSMRSSACPCKNGLGLEYIHRRHAGLAPVECGDQSASGSISSALDVLTSNAVGFMADRSSSLTMERGFRRSAQVQAQHVAGGKHAPRGSVPWQSRRVPPAGANCFGPRPERACQTPCRNRQPACRSVHNPRCPGLAGQLAADAEIGGMDAALSPDCCHAPCLRLPMYCGKRRIAAITRAQVSSAVGSGMPEPSATATPRSVQACTSRWLPTRPVWTISFRRGNFSMMARVRWVRSRISTTMSASLSRSTTGPCP